MEHTTATKTQRRGQRLDNIVLASAAVLLVALAYVAIGTAAFMEWGILLPGFSN